MGVVEMTVGMMVEVTIVMTMVQYEKELSNGAA
jgi:hypothetical protein